MNDERLGVADVGEVGEELDGVDELLARFVAAFDPEGDEAGLAGRAGTSARGRSTCWRPGRGS